MKKKCPTCRANTKHKYKLHGRKLCQDCYHEYLAVFDGIISQDLKGRIRGQSIKFSPHVCKERDS